MASGKLRVRKLPASDYELLGTATWNGTTLRCWRNGRTVTLAWTGGMTAAASSGAVNVYITIPTKYAPPDTFNNIVLSQSGKRFLLAVTYAGYAGLYYQLEATAAGDAACGVFTWAARSE